MARLFTTPQEASIRDEEFSSQGFTPALNSPMGIRRGFVLLRKLLSVREGNANQSQ
jgi:hypothetical protein